jgi:hypothetical protein
VNHSRPSSAEVKNEWSYTASPPICFHCVNRNKFTFMLAKLVSNVVDSYRMALFISICVNEYLTGPCGLFALCGCGLQFVTKPVLLQLIALLVINVT